MAATAAVLTVGLASGAFAATRTGLPSDTRPVSAKRGAVGSAPTGWTLTWSDEFSGATGTAPSGTNWEYDLGGEPAWGNKEWQYYTDRPDNVGLDGDGHLAITARRETLPGMAGCEFGPCDITSGRITTHERFAQRYGRFEARIKIPSGAGVWPAFWMLGDDIDTVGWPASGEIDVMEAVGNDPLSVFGTGHAAGFPENGIGSDGYQLPSHEALAAGYHRYAVQWSPDRIDWFVDDHSYFTLLRSSLTSGQTWAFDHPYYLLLNLAIGGDWAGEPDAGTFPATMLVDYVRVYRAA
jgi:beta-glucanase (GH16 family)